MNAPTHKKIPLITDTFWWKLPTSSSKAAKTLNATLSAIKRGTILFPWDRSN